MLTISRLNSNANYQPATGIDDLQLGGIHSALNDQLEVSALELVVMGVRQSGLYLRGAIDALAIGKANPLLKSKAISEDVKHI